jgi:hypothetical protein
VLSDPSNVLAVMKGGTVMKGEEFMKSVAIGATFGA